MNGRRLIVEADGGARGNPGPAAFGAVVRDATTGEVLTELAEPLGVTTNNVAEYRGLIAGLQAARQIDPQASVEARLDSRLVVEQMSGRWKIKNRSLLQLALQARDVLPAGQVTYRWVPRQLNTHADRLLNAVLDAATRGW
ncbi:MAG: reverse transcriptase-like protein [Jiangellaceae bacterium]|nr:reverse transcriptase-like protein [Jiangellaceae bacterium]